MKKLILTSFLLLIFSAFPLNTFAGDSSHCTPPGELGGADYCPGQDYWSGACQDRVTCDSGYSFSCSQGQCCFDNDDGTFNQITDPINDGTTCSAIHRSFNGCAAPSVCKNQCTSGWEKDPAIAWSSVDACRPKCASYEVRVGDACVFESTLIYSGGEFKADTEPGSLFVGVGDGSGGGGLQTFTLYTGGSRKWYYLGRINTQDGSGGGGERGYVDISMYDGHDPNHRYSAGTRLISATRVGSHSASHIHYGIEPIVGGYRDRSYFVIYNDGANNFHLFVDMTEWGRANFSVNHTYSNIEPEETDPATFLPPGSWQVYTTESAGID